MTMSATKDELLESIAVERALIALWAHLDAGQFDDVAASFSDDGIWYRQGKQLKGPTMVRAAMAERHPGIRTRHILSNTLVSFESPDVAQMSCYMCVFQHQGEPGAPLPSPMNVPLTVNQTNARMHRTGGGWKVAELRSHDTFRRT